MESTGYEDQRDPRVDATFVDGFDMEDEEEDRWEGPFELSFQTGYTVRERASGVGDDEIFQGVGKLSKRQLVMIEFGAHAKLLKPNAYIFSVYCYSDQEKEN